MITILGKKLLTIFIGDYDYEGEIDEQGKACGYGIAVSVKEPDSRWEGTFQNDLPHGFCRYKVFTLYDKNQFSLGAFNKGPNKIYESEYYKGDLHGKRTEYNLE